MAWNELVAERGRGSRTYRDTENPTQHVLESKLGARLHYGENLTNTVDMTPVRVDNAAFATPPDTPWRQTSQTWDHSAGIYALDAMEAAWDMANAQPPWYESKYMRRLNGPVRFAVDHPGRYRVTVHYRGAVDVFGKHLSSIDWTRKTFDVDVPPEFTVSGDGWLHAIIMEATHE